MRFRISDRVRVRVSQSALDPQIRGSADSDRCAPKLPLPVDRSPHPSTCLIHGPVRPIPCQTASGCDPPIFHTALNTQTHIPKNRQTNNTGMVCDYRPLSLYRRQCCLTTTTAAGTGIYATWLKFRLHVSSHTLGPIMDAYVDGNLTFALQLALIWLQFPLPSNRQYLSCDVCLVVKREDNQNCSVLCCVRQLCTVISTLRCRRAVHTVLRIGFCHICHCT